MDGQRADMVFTDPPYGVSYADKNKALNATGRGNRIQREIKNDHLSLDESFGLWRDSFGSLHSACKEGAAYYVSSPSGGEQMMMMKALDESGWPVRHTIIWVKNNHVLGRCDYHYKHEPILYGWKEGAGHTWFGGRSQFSVWNVDKPVKSELHPTMKPIELIEIPVMNNTKSGDIVIDLFGGSGSTLITCEKTSRHCRMMELDPIYCDVIITRWQDYTGQTAIHESGKTFAEITAARVKDVA
jgi:DNA modification methylase